MDLFDARAQVSAPVDISVLTLVRGRQAQLDNFICALSHQTGPAFELVIASMQDEPPAIARDLTFPVRVVTVPGQALPLAQARNMAARAACGALLVFLDVDCMAEPALVAHYAEALSTNDACPMGEVRYLPEDASPGNASYEALWQQAVQHPARPALPSTGLRREHNPRALWGLSFALRRERFFAAGGLNAAYCGYGGEETDFAMRLAHIDTPFAWLSGARALHQWHPISRPPLNHFHAIIANARRFHAAWGSWCLEYWLDAFARMGLIQWSLQADDILLLQEPTPYQVAEARVAGSSRSF